MAKTRTTKKTVATETVIESPPITVVAPKASPTMADLIKKPLHALLSFIYDEKANKFSAPRLILIVGNVFMMKVMWEIHDMIKDAVYAGREPTVPDWYYIEVVGYLIAINAPYLRSKGPSRFGRRRSYPSIPEEDE